MLKATPYLLAVMVLMLVGRLQTKHKWWWVLLSYLVFTGLTFLINRKYVDIYILVGIVCVCFWLMEKHFKGSGKKARTKALHGGIKIDAVNRELPYISSDDKPTVLKPGKAVRYSIKRHKTGNNYNWSFLMRTKVDGAQYPNGFLFLSDGGKPKALFQKSLEKIAQANESDYLEFEATEDSVNAYWEEWGGEKQAQKVHDWLVELSKY